MRLQLAFTLGILLGAGLAVSCIGYSQNNAKRYVWVENSIDEYDQSEYDRLHGEYVDDQVENVDFGDDEGEPVHEAESNVD